MAVSGNIVAGDGGQGIVKLHPYLFTLVRWCVSCLWSTTTVLLHRLMTTRIPQIPDKPPSKSSAKPRTAGREHLHPEPRVHCSVLHRPTVSPYPTSAPPAHTLDVIFVHGLYGSLGNTWRQGEWRSKYKIDLNFVPLRKHGASNNCDCKNAKTNLNDDHKDFTNGRESFNDLTFERINERLKTIEKTSMTDTFYDDTLLERVEVVDDYETQAEFVQDLFNNKECDSGCGVIDNCDCRVNDRKCEIGCGCVCEDCYSTCWPKDWIKEDFPGARVISINYTSDPYLWRPLWVKGNKRLRLHERADQMVQQLLELGVGSQPIVWVGHSKGGLFIKQIYCEAYEAHLEINNRKSATAKDDINCDEFNADNKINHINDTVDDKSFKDSFIGNEVNHHSNKEDRNNLTDEHESVGNFRNDGNIHREEFRNVDGNDENNFIINRDNDNNNDEERESYNITVNNGDKLKYNENSNDERESNNITVNNSDKLEYNSVIDNRAPNDVDINEQNNNDLNEYCKEDVREVEVTMDGDEAMTSIDDGALLRAKANIWSNSAGFMFYSVPHRGSPLADIKTPLTSRSVELLEISKDCSLVVALQRRWLRAVGGAGAGGAPLVRSVVETHRTLMSVLWLRIVSEDSADAGVGTLSGAPVDHREICKPASRACRLYRELTDLIHDSLNKCHCH